MGQHTINLPCIADTYIDNDNRYTNYGSATSLLIGDRNTGSSNYKKKGMFKFDLSSMPLRKSVSEALLRVYVIDKNVDQGGSITSGPTSQDFIENTATYENADTNPWPESHREIDGVLTGQYQNFALSLYYGLRDKCVISVFSTGNPPIYAYMHVSSRETANPPIMVVTYNDVPPSKPTLNSPIGSFEVNTEVIKLSWNYISSVGGIQKGFNLQWSTDQTTWTTVSQTTANNYYDVPADTFTAGNIYWRVQTIKE